MERQRGRDQPKLLAYRAEADLVTGFDEQAEDGQARLVSQGDSSSAAFNVSIFLILSK